MPLTIIWIDGEILKLNHYVKKDKKATEVTLENQGSTGTNDMLQYNTRQNPEKGKNKTKNYHPRCKNCSNRTCLNQEVKSSALLSIGQINVREFLSWKPLWDFFKRISYNSTGKKEEWTMQKPHIFGDFQ